MIYSGLLEPPSNNLSWVLDEQIPAVHPTPVDASCVLTPAGPMDTSCVLTNKEEGPEAASWVRWAAEGPVAASCVLMLLKKLSTFPCRREGWPSLSFGARAIRFDSSGVVERVVDRLQSRLITI